MAGRDIVVVGGSAGSIEVLARVCWWSAAGFSGLHLRVVHFPGSVTSTLPRILSRSGPLPAHHPRDRESIAQGRIYVAPPDCHLQISDGPVGLTRGPRRVIGRP
jgi:two-component system chemotaxis response regulator CheB